MESIKQELMEQARLLGMSGEREMSLLWKIDLLEKMNAELLDALHTALPFVEDAADDEVYKAHHVHKALAYIRAAIAKASTK